MLTRRYIFLPLYLLIVAKLDAMEYGIALALAVTVIPLVEIVKVIARAVRKKKGIRLA